MNNTKMASKTWECFLPFISWLCLRMEWWE